MSGFRFIVSFSSDHKSGRVISKDLDVGSNTRLLLLVLNVFAYEREKLKGRTLIVLCSQIAFVVFSPPPNCF